LLLVDDPCESVNVTGRNGSRMRKRKRRKMRRRSRSSKGGGREMESQK
jgi:hypothetical protein